MKSMVVKMKPERCTISRDLIQHVRPSPLHANDPATQIFKMHERDSIIFRSGTEKGNSMLS